MSAPMGNAGPNRSLNSRLSHVPEASGPFDVPHHQVSVLPDWKREVAAKSGVIVAVIIGVLAVLAVRIAQYHYSGTALISEAPMLTTVKEAGGALFLGLMMLVLLPYAGLKYVMVLIAAIAGATIAMHNAVHWSPGTFSLMFSPEWTEEVTTTTEPRSFYVLGDVIPIAPPGKEEKKMPTVLRLN